MRTVTSKDGTQIAYDVTGQGPPLILVLGAMGFRKFPNFVELAELLAPHFTVINYDRRGRGDSGDTLPYSVEREIEDLDAVIKDVGGSAYVFGTSSGAALALLAAARGVNIAKLAVYEPPYTGVDKSAHQPPADHIAQAKALIAEDRRAEAIKFFITKVMGAPVFIYWMMWFMPIWPKLKAVAHTLPYDFTVMGDFSLPTAQLVAIRMPTVLIAGDKSPAILQTAAKAAADAVPGAEFVALKGQSHNVSMKALAPVLVEYFET